MAEAQFLEEFLQEYVGHCKELKVCKKKPIIMIGTEKVVFKRLSTALLLTPHPSL
jgi:hypothetical protein